MYKNNFAVILKVNFFANAMANKLTSKISVYKASHWALYRMWFQNKSELYKNNFQYWGGTVTFNTSFGIKTIIAPLVVLSKETEWKT